MSKIITQCPSCSGIELTISKIECADCHTIFTGKFDISVLDKLSEANILFVIDFVKCSGSLKEMAVKQKVSYPTLRNRLNDLIESIEKLESIDTTSRADILSLLEQGRITAKEAADRLKKL